MSEQEKRRERARRYAPHMWPTTKGEWCEWFRGLDEHYGTPVESPLHHDNRCPLCKAGRR